jgi:hypothetical protein
VKFNDSICDYCVKGYLNDSRRLKGLSIIDEVINLTIVYDNSRFMAFYCDDSTQNDVYFFI